MDINKNFSELILSPWSSLLPKRWLDQEVNELALSVSGLDEFKFEAVQVLAKIVEHGSIHANGIYGSVYCSEIDTDGFLEDLEINGFIEQSISGYSATKKGVTAFNELGRRIANRYIFELDNRLKSLRLLVNKIDGNEPEKCSHCKKPY